ncbi:MAG: hypothetical protein ACXVA9_00120 [Bdellovibrionales bacterium]
MKILFIILISFSAFQASADIDCDIKIGNGEKRTELKAEFKKINDDKESTSYEFEKDGYTFTAIVRKPGSPIVQQVGILDQSSNNRTVASYHGMKPDLPDAFLMAVIANEKATPAKFAKLTCRLK